MFALLTICCSAVGAQNLVANGGFEDGLNGWTIWDPAPDQLQTAWTREVACYTAPTTPGCAFAGNGAYGHSGEGLNANGGIFQVIQVQPGRQYRISGHWRGHASVASIANGTSWAVFAYEGALDAEMVSRNFGSSQLVAVLPLNNVPPNGWGVGWLPFSRVIRVGHSSSSMTLALRHSSSNNHFAALYLDDVTMELLYEPSQQVPLDSRLALLMLAAGLMVVGVWRMRPRWGLSARWR